MGLPRTFFLFGRVKKFYQALAGPLIEYGVKLDSQIFVGHNVCVGAWCTRGYT
jgi:hypothetical protein